VLNTQQLLCCLKTIQVKGIRNLKDKVIRRRFRLSHNIRCSHSPSIFQDNILSSLKFAQKRTRRDPTLHTSIDVQPAGFWGE
jgi:hypothetical protein